MATLMTTTKIGLNAAAFQHNTVCGRKPTAIVSPRPPLQQPSADCLRLESFFCGMPSRL